MGKMCVGNATLPIVYQTRLYYVFGATLIYQADSTVAMRCCFMKNVLKD